MRNTEQSEVRTAIDWSQFLGAALLLSVTCAFVALAIGGAVLIDDPLGFFADNAMSRTNRIRLVVVVLGGGVVGRRYPGLRSCFGKTAVPGPSTSRRNGGRHWPCRGRSRGSQRITCGRKTS